MASTATCLYKPLLRQSWRLSPVYDEVCLIESAQAFTQLLQTTRSLAGAYISPNSSMLQGTNFMPKT